MKKMIRRVLIGVVLLAVIALITVAFSMNYIIKQGVEMAGPKLAKVSMTLDKARVSLFTGGGGLYGLVVGNPDGFKSPFAIKMGETSVAIKPTSLLSDKIVVKSVHVMAPEITLEGNLKGNNLSTILANVESSLGLDKKRDTQTAPAAEAQKPGKKIQVDDFLFSGAKVTLSLTELGGKSTTIPLPDIHLTDLGKGSDGITAGELVRLITKAILDSTTQNAGGSVSALAKGAVDAGKAAAQEATDTVNKTTQGITDLFKKK